MNKEGPFANEAMLCAIAAVTGYDVSDENAKSGNFDCTLRQATYASLKVLKRLSYPWTNASKGQSDRERYEELYSQVSYEINEKFPNGVSEMTKPRIRKAILDSELKTSMEEISKVVEECRRNAGMGGTSVPMFDEEMED